MGRIRDGETALALAVPHSESLRTTVPANVVRKLQLNAKDHVFWDIDKIDNEWVATIRKVISTE